MLQAGFDSRCSVQVAYAGGKAEPLSLSVASYGSARSFSCVHWNMRNISNICIYISRPSSFGGLAFSGAFEALKTFAGVRFRASPGKGAGDKQTCQLLLTRLGKSMQV
jgi:hypothetical protein